MNKREVEEDFKAVLSVFVAIILFLGFIGLITYPQRANSTPNTTPVEYQTK